MPTVKSKSHPKFCTGAKPSPRLKLAQAAPWLTRARAEARPIVVPSQLEMWLNDLDGDCVTAEEAAAIAFYSVMLGLPEILITDATVRAFCEQFGFLNGANLTDVMDRMISPGFSQGPGYRDGPYNAVNWADEANLQSALEAGPVKIGIDSTALPPGAGNGNGWYAAGGPSKGRAWRIFGDSLSEDHCVGIWNYGASADLFNALRTAVPTGFPAKAYHVYTWASVGVVDHPWLMSTVGEAWLRNPTTIGLPAPGPDPGPGPGPAPTPGPATPYTMTFQTPVQVLLEGGPAPALTDGQCQELYGMTWQELLQLTLSIILGLQSQRQARQGGTPTTKPPVRHG